MLGIMVIYGFRDNADTFFSHNKTKLLSSSVMCVKGAPSAIDIMGYETLENGEVVAKKDNNTAVVIYHDVNGVKKICLLDNNTSGDTLR